MTEQELPTYQTMDESIANLVQQLGEMENPRVLAHISQAEHSALAVALAFNVWAKIDVLTEFVNKYLQLSAARKGLARKQLTSIGIASMRPPPDEQIGALGKFRRWLSGSGGD